MAEETTMIDAYKNKRDLYADIATKVYHNTYWDNMEHHEDGTPNPAGKKRRSNCKSILLGIMYGRGAASIAEQIGSTIQEAQGIVNSFYNGYPKVKKWIDKTQEDAKQFGYVEDLWGRRRRLPDIQREPVTVEYVDKERPVVEGNFNPLIGSTGKFSTNVKSDLDMYKEKALATKGRKEMEKLKAEALTKGIAIHENGGFIAQAERQCVNARIQGGSATITKCAMLKVHNDQILKDLGFKLLICVHDELIGECPEENATVVGERLSQLMIDSVKGTVICPMKCDSTIEKSWYLSDYADDAKEQYEKLLAAGKSSNEAFETVWAEREECTLEELKEMLEI